MDEHRRVDVKACPRCGEDHDALPFWANRDAFGVLVKSPPYYAYCPETADPLALMPDKEGNEKVIRVA